MEILSTKNYDLANKIKQYDNVLKYLYLRGFKSIVVKTSQHSIF